MLVYKPLQKRGASVWDVPIIKGLTGSILTELLRFFHLSIIRWMHVPEKGNHVRSTSLRVGRIENLICQREAGSWVGVRAAKLDIRSRQYFRKPW